MAAPPAPEEALLEPVDEAVPLVPLAPDAAADPPSAVPLVALPWLAGALLASPVEPLDPLVPLEPSPVPVAWPLPPLLAEVGGLLEDDSAVSVLVPVEASLVAGLTFVIGGGGATLWLVGWAMAAAMAKLLMSPDMGLILAQCVTLEESNREL